MSHTRARLAVQKPQNLRAKFFFGGAKIAKNAKIRAQTGQMWPRARESAAAAIAEKVDKQGHSWPSAKHLAPKMAPFLARRAKKGSGRPGQKRCGLAT